MVCLGAVALLAWGAATVILSLPLPDPRMQMVPVYTYTPLLSACVIGLGAFSPFGEPEDAASLPLPVINFFYLGGLLFWATVLFFLVSAPWTVDSAGWTLVRNLYGFTGLSLLTSCLLGSRLSWIGPLGFDALTVFGGRAEAPVSGDGLLGLLSNGAQAGQWEMWAWSMRPVSDLSSWSLASTLLCVGLIMVCRYGFKSAA